MPCCAHCPVPVALCRCLVSLASCLVCACVCIGVYQAAHRCGSIGTVAAHTSGVLFVTGVHYMQFLSKNPKPVKTINSSGHLNPAHKGMIKLPASVV